MPGSRANNSRPSTWGEGGTSMKAKFTSGNGLDELLAPDAPAWAPQPTQAIKLMGTPASLQPTEAIRAAWRERPIGAVDQVEARALHNGKHLFFRLEWADPSENRDHGDNSVFPDGAAIALPVHPQSPPPLITMGVPGNGINAWYWRANEPEYGRHVLAEGYGTSQTLDRDQVRTRGEWRNGRWRVVIARALQVHSAHPVSQIETGQLTRFGLVIWEGGRAERAGLKAFSGDWIDLELEQGS